jgi:lysylphosphatidylglycerol synthetase-like protein (DUF2156 family)
VSETQPERTRLAWRRSVLTATVVALLSVRYALHHGPTPWGIALASLIALTWLTFLVGVQRRIRTMDGPSPGAMRPPWPALAGATVVAMALLAGATLW